MGKIITNDEFKNEIYTLNPSLELLSQYINAISKIKIQCKKCGYKWETTPHVLKASGAKCPQCSGKIITTDFYKTKVFNEVGDEYFVLGAYIDSSTPIQFKHNKCGTVFKMKPANFFKSKTKCSNKLCKHDIYIGMNEKEFINKSKNLGYLPKSKYIGIDSKMDYECMICHNEFSLNKAGKIFEKIKTSHCPYCSNIKITNKNKKKFINTFNILFGEQFDLVSDYIGADNPIKIKHKKCNCISEYSKAGKLLTDYIFPCKKCNISNGETSIMNYFTNKNIEVVYQKTFEELHGVNNGELSYDFYVPSYNLLIEFQGKQHEKPIEYFGGEQYFQIQQEHDKRKRQYAKEHSIKLLEIWYWDFDNIEQILDKELSLLV